MITPKEISLKAARKVNAFLIAQLKGERFTPWLVRFRSPKENEMTWSEVDTWIQKLEAKSKEALGYGYRIEYKSRRFHGDNDIPDRVIFDTAEDVFRSAGRLADVKCAIANFERITQRFAVLREWCLSHVATLVSSDKEFPDILSILDNYLANPRPNCYRREFVAAPHSKYLEDHEKLLAELLDLVAPEYADQSQRGFDERFGFKKQPRTCWVRFLDPTYTPAGIPGDWMALPFETLAQMRLPPKLLISENRTPLLSLPQYKDTLGIWGSGGASALLAQQRWVNQRGVFYWGDLDCHGLSIYGKFKEFSKDTHSLLMEDSLLSQFSELVGKYEDSAPKPSDYFTPEELKLFWHVVNNNLRLEQERIPHKYVLSALEVSGFR